MPIVSSPIEEVNAVPDGYRVRVLTGGPDALRGFARDAVAAYRRRQLAATVLSRPVEAARCALLAHLANLSATDRVLDEDAATRIAIAVIHAYLQEPVGYPCRMEGE